MMFHPEKNMWKAADVNWDSSNKDLVGAQKNTMLLAKHQTNITWLSSHVCVDRIPHVTVITVTASDIFWGGDTGRIP